MLIFPISGCGPNVKHIKENYNKNKNAIAVIGINRDMGIDKIECLISNKDNNHELTISSDAETVLLSPGNWEIKKLKLTYSYPQGDYIITRWMDFKDPKYHPYFKVNPGDISYLGTFWVNIVRKFTGNDYIITPKIVDNFEEEKKKFENSFPEFEGKFTKNLMQYTNFVKKANKVNEARGIIHYHKAFTDDKWYFIYPITGELKDYDQFLSSPK
jgi:hypothetical protein